MKKMMAKKAGFTLIELMIVVAILGILAAIAIPAFATYIRRSKTGEAYENLEAMFKGASTYYNKDRTTGAGIASAQVSHCSIPADHNNITASDVKQQGSNGTVASGYDESVGIGFQTGFTYFRFENTAGTGATTCGGTFNTTSYTFTALGDLDNDGASSTFSLATATNGGNELYKAGQVFVANELE